MVWGGTLGDEKIAHLPDQIAQQPRRDPYRFRLFSDDLQTALLRRVEGFSPPTPLMASRDVNPKTVMTSCPVIFSAAEGDCTDPACSPRLAELPLRRAR